MKKICKICNNEFEASRSQKTCSTKCSDINKGIYIKNRPTNNRLKYELKMEERSKELGLPKHYIKTYGYEFLKENTLVLETIKLQQLMTGKKDIPEEVKDIRKNARVTPKEINRRNFKPTVRTCKICGGEYTGIGPKKTCSDICSDKLKKETVIKSRERYKGVKWNINPIKQKESYEIRWMRIKSVSLWFNITTREAKQLLTKKTK